MLNLKIGIMPGRIEGFIFEGEVTVRDALTQAKDTFTSPSGNPVEDFLNGSTGYQAKLDGEVVELTDVIYDDGALVIAKQVKGNK